MDGNDKDDLHEALAQMADGVEPPAPGQVDTPADLLSNDADQTANPPEPDVAAAPSPSTQGEKASPAEPTRSVPKAAFAVVLLVVGGLLLAWAAYGGLILAGACAVERQNAESMAKLMLFAGGPVGLILLPVGAAGLRSWMSTKNNRR